MSESALPAAHSAEEQARRRRNSARIAWALAAAVVLLYGLGFLVPR